MRWPGRSRTSCSSMARTCSCILEGQPLDFPSTVTVHTEPEWHVATGLAAAAGSHSFTATNYHDLVDMPFFIGRFDFDSAASPNKWVRFATYPAGTITGPARQKAWDQIRQGDPAGDRGVRRGAVGQLHRDADRRLVVRRRERPGTPELTPRRARPVVRRRRVPAVAVRPRDLSFVEREAAAAGRDVAI